MDPLAGKYLAYSTYNYVLGNPIRLFDPKGLDVFVYGKDSTQIATIITGDKQKQKLYTKLDIKTDKPYEIDISGLLKKFKNIAAWGISVNASVTFGGGVNGGFDIVHFNKGINKNEWHLFGTAGVNLGLDAGAGITGFVAWNNTNSPSSIKFEDWNGTVNGYSVEGGFATGGYFWSNTDNKDQLWDGQHKNTGVNTTWHGYFVGGGPPTDLKFGARWYSERVKHMKRLDK